jgi:hypothetical protein
MSTEFLSGKTKFFPDFQKLIGGHGARPLKGKGPLSFKCSHVRRREHKLLGPFAGALR